MSKQDYGLDYENAVRILRRYGKESTLQPEDLAELLKEARERNIREKVRLLIEHREANHRKMRIPDVS